MVDSRTTWDVYDNPEVSLDLGLGSGLRCPWDTLDLGLHGSAWIVGQPRISVIVPRCPWDILDSGLQGSAWIVGQPGISVIVLRCPWDTLDLGLHGSGY